MNVYILTYERAYAGVYRTWRDAFYAVTGTLTLNAQLPEGKEVGTRPWAGSDTKWIVTIDGEATEYDIILDSVT